MILNNTTEQDITVWIEISSNIYVAKRIGAAMCQRCGFESY
jgi:hypothetical protein